MTKQDRNQGNESVRSGWVSVIVPTYNRAGMIVDALDSVRNQTYRPIELLIVDDGSTDDTREGMQRYAETYAEPGRFDIRYLHQENQGTTAARNHGLREATGEFIQHLDSDDRLLPDKLEKQVRILRDDPAIDYVYGRAQYMDEAGQILKEVGRPIERDDTWTHVAVYHWQTCAPLYRRQVLNAIGPGDERVRCAEDLINPARLKVRDFHEHFMPEAVCVWQVHSGPRNVESGLSSAMTSEIVADDILANLRAENIRCLKTDNTLARYYARAGLIMARENDKAGARRCLKKATNTAHGAFRGLAWIGRIAERVLPAAFLCWIAHALWWRARQNPVLHAGMRPGSQSEPTSSSKG